MRCREPAGACAVAPVLPRQEAAGERAPDEDADPLVEARRDELVLRLAGLQRVVDLLAHVALRAEAIGDRERLHEVPAREVRAADVADLPLTDERVERLDRLLDRGLPVPLVHLVEVDVVDPEAPQAVVAGAHEVLTRETRVVRSVPDREARLRRDEQSIAPPLDRCPDDLLGDAARVDVGGVDDVDTGVQAAIDEKPRAAPVGGSDLLEVSAATEGHRAQGERRDA